MEKICDICQLPFEAAHDWDMYCPECRLTKHKALKKEEKPKPTKTNKKLIEQVKEAARLGISYGQYKGRQK